MTHIDVAPCLAHTGSTVAWPLIIIALVLIVAGGVLMFMRRKKGIAVLAIAPLLIGGFMMTSAPAPAQAETVDTSCSSAAPVAPVAPTTGTTAPAAPTATPTTTPTVTPTPTPTPTVAPVGCPAGNDIATLPAGDTITWVPVTGTDPRDTPGAAGQYVSVWEGGISGYTWHITRGADGTTSGDCIGTPTSGGACVASPEVSYTEYMWDATTAAWVPSGGAGSNNGCSGGGGNS